MKRPALLRSVAWLLAVALAAAGCADDGKKIKRDCDSDAECEGGVCFDQQCYAACTSKDDCASDEICVWKSDGERELSLCVVAADQIFETEEQCAAGVRLGPCEQVAFEGSRRACEVEAIPGCDEPDDGTDALAACNAGQLTLTASEPGALPFDVAGLPTLGVLGFVGEEGDDSNLYLWLKSAPEPAGASGGNAIVLFVSLPTGAEAPGEVVPDGVAFVNGGGVIGVDAEWLEIDDERSKLSWTSGSIEAGAELTGTLDLTLVTVCGTGLYEAHLVAEFTATLKSIYEVVSARNDCLQVLSSAISFPAMRLGQLELSLDGAPYPLADGGTGNVNVSLAPESGSLSLTAATDGHPVISLYANDVVLGAQPASLVVNAADGPTCAWQAELDNALTLEATSGDLAVGPVTGRFEGTVPLQQGSDASCSGASRALVGTFTAAICR